jgi:hypothetical protein
LKANDIYQGSPSNYIGRKLERRPAKNNDSAPELCSVKNASIPIHKIMVCDELG